MSLRSQDEIVSYYRNHEKENIFGLAGEVLLPYLDVDHVKEFASSYADLSSWTVMSMEEESILTCMRDYMAFAWGKVQDHRGISAKRSVEKMEAWLWLLGKDTLLEEVRKAPYQWYCAPKLALICESLGFPIPDGEDIENMRQGNPRYPGRSEGCRE